MRNLSESEIALVGGAGDLVAADVACVANLTAAVAAKGLDWKLDVLAIAACWDTVKSAFVSEQKAVSSEVFQAWRDVQIAQGYIDTGISCDAIPEGWGEGRTIMGGLRAMRSKWGLSG